MTSPAPTRETQQNSSGLLNRFNMDDLLNCAHCGMCLAVCPTYQQTHMETYSPRGRIGLMKAAALGQLPLDEEFAKHIDFCLDCRACESACPSGVKYASLVETARDIVQENWKQSGRKRPLLRALAFDSLFMHHEQMERVGKLVWFAQAAGLQKLAQVTGLINILPAGMVQIQNVVGKLPSPTERKQRSQVVPAASEKTKDNKPLLRVGLFTGCVMDQAFFDVNQATARVLAKAGCEVVFYPNQECCGALHGHSGEIDAARELAKKNIEAFEKSGMDFLVNNAGGCGAALRDYYEWLKDDEEWATRARNFVDKVRDVSELLVTLPPLSFTKQISARVTYQDSCHLAHGQGVRFQPRQLIQSIPGVEYVELENADTCCGSAGVYNITHSEMSLKVLERKMSFIKRTNADIVVTANPGCLLQVKLGIHRAGLENKVKAVHIVELLDEVL